MDALLKEGVGVGGQTIMTRSVVPATKSPLRLDTEAEQREDKLYYTSARFYRSKCGS